MKESVIKSGVIPSHDPFTGPEIERVIYTTEAQAEIWVACKLGDSNANRSYNESVSLILKGNLNKVALLKAIERLVVRHEALRSVFSTDGRFMTIFKTLPVTTDYYDLSDIEDYKKNKTLTDYLKAESNYVFDLVKGPLFKLGLIKTSKIEHQLIITAHHIICDGWSYGIILEELGSLYTAYNTGVKPNISAPDKFSTYADQQHLFIESSAYNTTESYWLKQYETNVPIVDLPTDFPRPKLRTFKGNRLDFTVDSSLVSEVKKTGIKSGASFVVTLLAAFEVFLYHQTGQDDLVLGLPAAGQSQSGKTQLIGHCVNLLPLRSKLSSEIPFNDYLKTRKTEILDAFEHQQFSFGQLLQKLTVPRDPSRIPLVPIMFNIDMGMANAVEFDGLNYTLRSNPRAYEAFELFLNATGTEDELILEWSYNVSLFKPDTIKKMMLSFKEVLKSVVKNPTVKIGDAVSVDDSAYKILNDTLVPYPQVPLYELLTKQSKISPSKTAIKFGNSEITYENLENQVNQLTHSLISKGVVKGDFIGVSLPRSIELVITLISIMKCGAAYLPLDPNYPKNRLEFMLKDSNAKYLITSQNLLSSLSTQAELLTLEDVFSNLSKYSTAKPNITISNNELAYLLYTSGSTGKPKGVPVTHKNLVNFLISMLEAPGIKAIDKLLSITTISFDIAGLELFAPLLKGAQLVLTNDETAKDSRLLLELMKSENISIMQATPTTWQMLLDAGWTEHLKIKALCGGEALPMVLAQNIIERVDELWNMYGPTETTIWSAVKQIRKEDNIITIGRPINNTQIYIINNHNALVETGKTGELCIAGDGVAQGYWCRPDLTSEKFIKNPFDTDIGSILYRTGDLAKLLPSGEIQCLGRIDQQIKIRGHRIELGEIERALDTLEDVQSSIVVLNNGSLVANLITHNIINSINEKISTWKETLREHLPPHMVPQQFNLLEEFPTTLNGKIDRKSLLNQLSNNVNSVDFKEPITKSEQIIATIWQQCLEIDNISIQSDFFELGGHSLIAVRIMSLIERQTGNRLPLAALLEQPTIKKLAAYMDRQYFKWDSLVTLNPEGNKAPLFIVHGANHNVLIYKNLANNLSKDQPAYALQAKGLNGESEPHDSIEEMASHYIKEIRAKYPEGPYALAGFSFGGIIAFEMAKQLKSEDVKVKHLALFDSYVYPSYYYTNPLIKRVIAKSYDLAQLIYMGLNWFSSQKNFKRRNELIKLRLSGLFLRLKYGKKKQYEIQFNRTPEIDKKHALAFIRYNIIPSNIKVDLFRATKNIYFAHDFKYLGWKKIALGGICKHMVKGTHSDMFLSPTVEEFAKTLQNVLDN